MKTILRYLIVLVLTGTITATIKNCCPGENMYDLYAGNCTEEWTEKQANLNVQCEHPMLGHGDSDILNGEILLDFCFVTLLFPDSRCNSTETAYYMCRNEKYLEITNIVYIVGFLLMVISFPCLILTVAVYIILSKLRDLQEICIIHALCSQIGAYASLVLLYFSGVSYIICQVFATITYFSSTYTFWWLLILSFHIWRTTVKSNSCKNLNWSLIYHIIGTLAPLFGLTILLIVEHHPSEIFDKFRPNLSRCWFKGIRPAWIFLYGPLSVILCLDLMFYVWTIGYLWKQPRSSKNGALKYRVGMCAELCIIMALSCFIDLIMYSYEDKIDTMTMHILFVLIPHVRHTLEGISVFLILVVFRKRVRRLLAEKKFCNRQVFPISWTNLQDQEMDSEQIKGGHTENNGTEIGPIQET